MYSHENVGKKKKKKTISVGYPFTCTSSQGQGQLPWHIRENQHHVCFLSRSCL